MKLSIVTDRTTGVNADGVYYVSRNVRDTEIIINNKENTLINDNIYDHNKRIIHEE